jgi:PAS domain S-box-containing protein
MAGKLAVLLNPEDSYEMSSILLARTACDGTLQLLSGAWEKLLGYGRRELQDKPLDKLMAADREGDGLIAGTIAAIFDERSMASVELTLRCRSGERRRMRLHRRHHASARTIYIVGERIVDALR